MKFSGYKEMNMALEMARSAALRGEVPVGAVITDVDGNIIAQAHNMVEGLCDATAHAELLALKQASSKLKNRRLAGCTLFVTLEPCAMCAAAISHARIDKLVYAASDEKGGAVENGPRLFAQPTLMHKPEIISGVLAEESAKLLQNFFGNLRK